LKLIIATLGIFYFSTAFANSPIGLLKIMDVKKSKPYVDKKHVKVWNAKLTDVIRLNVIEFTGELPLHKHPDAGHNMLVLQGSVRVLLGKDKFQAEKGSLIFIPKGVPHKYWTIGKSATLISMDAPYYDRNKTVNLE
jgi:quercetin dioxygenase-like cupin family protein